MQNNARDRFYKRRHRARRKIQLVSTRNRLSVFKSGKHIYAQIIDDVRAVTLVSVSTLDKAIRVDGKSCGNKIHALAVGKLIGEKAAKGGIKTVVFDKSGYKYHGIVAALAEGARANLNF